MVFDDALQCNVKFHELMRRSYIPSTAKLQKAPQAFMCEIVHSNSCLYVSYLSSFLNFQITHLFIRCENLHLHNLCHLNVLTGMASTRFHHRYHLTSSISSHAIVQDPHTHTHARTLTHFCTVITCKVLF